MLQIIDPGICTTDLMYLNTTSLKIREAFRWMRVLKTLIWALINLSTSKHVFRHETQYLTKG